MTALNRAFRPHFTTSNPCNFPIRNSDGATYAELRQRRLDKVRELARLEGFWNEARDWAEWAWYHEAKAHLASIVRGSSSDRRIDSSAGNLYLVGSRKGD